MELRMLAFAQIEQSLAIVIGYFHCPSNSVIFMQGECHVRNLNKLLSTQTWCIYVRISQNKSFTLDDDMDDVPITVTSEGYPAPPNSNAKNLYIIYRKVI